jgi:hypothetical protein
MSNPEPIIALMKLPVLLEYNTRSLARLYPSTSHRQPYSQIKSYLQETRTKIPNALQCQTHAVQ